MAGSLHTALDRSVYSFSTQAHNICNGNFSNLNHKRGAVKINYSEKLISAAVEGRIYVHQQAHLAFKFIKAINIPSARFHRRHRLCTLTYIPRNPSLLREMFG